MGIVDPHGEGGRRAGRQGRLELVALSAFGRRNGQPGCAEVKLHPGDEVPGIGVGDVGDQRDGRRFEEVGLPAGVLSAAAGGWLVPVDAGVTTVTSSGGAAPGSDWSVPAETYSTKVVLVPGSPIGGVHSASYRSPVVLTPGPP